MNRSGIIPIDRHKPSPAKVRRVAAHLDSGGVAVLPTETQYALTADATVPDVLASIRRIKGRSEKKPLSIFLADRSLFGPWKISVPSWAIPLMETFLPGPLTLILPTNNPIFRRLGTVGSVGIRISSEPIIRDVGVTTGRLLVATSANPSGRCLSPAAENRWLTQQVSQGDILWARPRYYRRRRPSTIIDCCSGRPVLVRDGAVPARLWRSVLT